MDMQALIDGLGARHQRERAENQMTLGQMIERLESMPADMLIDGITELESYRGYYCDLAFAPSTSKVTVADTLTMCRAAMGEVFTGYKGGDYVMGKLTPLWLAHYGCCGKKIMGINSDGTLITEDED